jgi:hypothetical protein
MFGAFIAKRFVLRLEPETFSPGHGRHHARGWRFLAVVGNNFIKSTSFYYSDLNHPQGEADEVTHVTCHSRRGHR